jgi:hypothetical protein
MARGEHALDRRLPLGDGALEHAAALRDMLRLRAQPAPFGRRARELAVRVGDGALGVAQGVARFLARAFLLVELAVERLDPLPQVLELLFP